jgi:S1-C subfamily serine protease
MRHPLSSSRRVTGLVVLAALVLGALLPRSAPASAQPAVGRPTATPAATPTDGGIESRIRLRPIDRASVRVLQITGAEAFTFESRTTRVRRAVSIPAAVHGTGVVVGPEGLVLTAAHVVRGGDVLAVLRPGADEPQAARVIYSDAEHDLAVLAVDGPLPDRITLPTAIRPLELSERLFATGYPLDIRERYPAAVSGELSRENNDGSLQVAMSVNPGNSGGPVIDADGALVGIMARRGEPTRGVEGIAMLEPLRFVLPAMARARAVLGQRPVTFAPQERHIVRVMADFVRTTDERPIFEQTAVATLDLAAQSPPQLRSGRHGGGARVEHADRAARGPQRQRSRAAGPRRPRAGRPPERDGSAIGQLGVGGCALSHSQLQWPTWYSGQSGPALGASSHGVSDFSGGPPSKIDAAR